MSWTQTSVSPPSDEVLRDNSSVHNNGQNDESKSLVYIINSIMIITNTSSKLEHHVQTKPFATEEHFVDIYLKHTTTSVSVAFLKLTRTKEKKM